VLEYGAGTDVDEAPPRLRAGGLQERGDCTRVGSHRAERIGPCPAFCVGARGADRIGRCRAFVGHGRAMDAGVDALLLDRRANRRCIGEVEPNPGYFACDGPRIGLAKRAAVLRHHLIPTRCRLPHDLVADVTHSARDEESHYPPPLRRALILSVKCDCGSATSSGQTFLPPASPCGILIAAFTT